MLAEDMTEATPQKENPAGFPSGFLLHYLCRPVTLAQAAEYPSA
jgi:hypothetical protein